MAANRPSFVVPPAASRRTGLEEMSSQPSSVLDVASPDWRVPTRSYGTSNPSWSNIERRTTKHNYKDNSGVGNSGARSNANIPSSVVLPAAAASSAMNSGDYG